MYKKRIEFIIDITLHLVIPTAIVVGMSYLLAKSLFFILHGEWM